MLRNTKRLGLREVIMSKKKRNKENFLFMKEQECFYGGGQFLVIIGNSRTWEKANYKGYLYLEEENAFYEILQ